MSGKEAHIVNFFLVGIFFSLKTGHIRKAFKGGQHKFQNIGLDATLVFIFVLLFIYSLEREDSLSCFFSFRMMTSPFVRN